MLLSLSVMGVGEISIWLNPHLYARDSESIANEAPDELAMTSVINIPGLLRAVIILG